jgi:Flp pilus assembly protein TadD
MTKKLGDGESATKARWDGYLALKERRYQEAEEYFRKALSIKPNDFVSSINLVYALMGQREMQEARRLYRGLVDRYPMNDKVLALGDALTTR